MKHLRTVTYVAEVARAGSIRRAAERLNLTPSALTRQIQDLEYELGTPIFERLPQGMRLNAAGELFARHIRDQAADLDRVRSQIADLSGVRRGHVALACSQAFVTRAYVVGVSGISKSAIRRRGSARPFRNTTPPRTSIVSPGRPITRFTRSSSRLPG